MNSQEFPIIAAYIEERIEKTKSVCLGLILSIPSVFGILFSL